MVKLGLSISDDEPALDNDMPELEGEAEDQGDMEKVD